MLMDNVKKKREYLRVLFTVFLISSSYSFGSSVEITFFDVGQGNCTLVCGAEDLDETPLLIDCGSNSLRHRSGRKREDVFDEIIKKLNEYFVKKSIGNRVFNVALSHPDVDHYKWINMLVGICAKRIPSIEISKVWLGGNQKDYQKSNNNINDLVRLAHDVVQVVPNRDITEVSEKIKILPMYTSDSKKSRNTNDESLVIRIDHGGKSCLITGDATDKTIEYLKQLVEEHVLDADLLKADILLASHHGAESDGSNNLNFINSVNPKFVVFSAGLSGNCHPRPITMYNYMDPKLRLETLGSYHLLCFGIKSKKDKHDCRFISFAQIFTAKGNYTYGIYLTDKGAYCTLTQGTISFILEDAGRELSPPKYTISREYSNFKECAIAGCNFEYIDGFKIDAINYVDLSNLDFNDIDKLEDRKIIEDLLVLLQDKAKSLKKIDLSRNDIGFNDNIVRLALLLKEKQTIRIFKIDEKNLSYEQMKALEVAWNSRGLEFVNRRVD